ncbi:tail fiber protein [Tabrizicola sp.]|uniref:phage tail protein n=1 Tax=Tabrizicola sp. TaxID=2005166 RepID=UPI00286CDC60|nr:tail fiber protein [Tabrizicola sp.]
MFGGNFAPAGWAFCQGQLLPISENDTLFTLIGTTYGGDGQQTFALPDLRGRVPVHQGSGFIIGQSAGTESVTLTTQQIPIHNHTAQCRAADSNSGTPQNSVWAKNQTNQTIYSTVAPATNMNAAALGQSGGNQPHDNMMPFLVINFIISLYGVFPSPN